MAELLPCYTNNSFFPIAIVSFLYPAWRKYEFKISYHTLWAKLTSLNAFVLMILFSQLKTNASCLFSD